MSNINKKKIFLVVGRTGAGKTAVVKSVCKQLGLTQLKSYKTLPMRDDEKKGKTDHIFIETEEVDNYKDDFAAYTEIGDHIYFTTKTDLDLADIYVIDPHGIEDLFERCKDEYDFVTIYIRRSENLRKDSCAKRGENFNFDERNKAENEQFTAFEKKMPWDLHILNNYTLEEAVSTMKKFITKELNLTGGIYD